MSKWFAVLLTIAALPFAIPYAVFADCMFRRRLRCKARITDCPVCGALLGDKALELANQTWSNYVTELLRMYPGRKLRLVRFVNAICTQCGASLKYDKQSNILQITKPIPSEVERHD